VDWIGLAKDRNRWRALVNSVLNLRVPWNAGKLSSGLLISVQLHIVSYRIFSNLIRTHFKVSEGKKVRCGLDSRSRAAFWKNDRAGVLTFFV
jgi:hypothetical protein